MSTRSTVQKEKKTLATRQKSHDYPLSLSFFDRYIHSILIYTYIYIFFACMCLFTYLYSPILPIISVFIAHHNTIRKISSRVTITKIGRDWISQGSRVTRPGRWKIGEKKLGGNLPLGISDRIRGEGWKNWARFSRRERGKRFRGG